jgi:hypothetical protein
LDSAGGKIEAVSSGRPRRIGTGRCDLDGVNSLRLP